MNTFIRSLIVVALSVLSITTLAQATTYTVAPSWSPMTMLNASFDITAQRLDVVNQADFSGVGVYPVLAVNVYSDPLVMSGVTGYGRPDLAATTLASFDPGKPWGVLNGTAFSRRMGWNPGGATRADRPAAAAALKESIESVYGSNACIWIECISRSTGFEAYQAVGQWGVNADDSLDANFVPNIDPSVNGYSPIFGTAGSSTKWKWDYMMDHNTYAVGLDYITEPNQLFTATYKVYVGNITDGSEILNLDGSSAASLETWTWQGPANVPEPVTLAVLLGGAAVIAAKRRKAAK